MKKGRKFWHIFAFIGVFAAAIAITMSLWNALIPSIIGWTAINYWQAAGLLILCRLLFGGMGHHMRGHGCGHGHHGFGHHGFGHMKGHELHEKLKGMPFDEKREYIRRRMAGMPDSSDERDGTSTTGKRDEQ